MTEPGKISEQPVRHQRADSRATVSVLVWGTLVAVVVFAVSFTIRLIGYDNLSDLVGEAGVLALLVTPVAALVATAVELRRADRRAWVMALVVLLILAAAALLAVFAPH